MAVVWSRSWPRIFGTVAKVMPFCRAVAAKGVVPGGGRAGSRPWRGPPGWPPVCHQALAAPRPAGNCLRRRSGAPAGPGRGGTWARRGPWTSRRRGRPCRGPGAVRCCCQKTSLVVRGCTACPPTRRPVSSRVQTMICLGRRLDRRWRGAVGLLGGEQLPDVLVGHCSPRTMRDSHGSDTVPSVIQATPAAWGRKRANPREIVPPGGSGPAGAREAGSRFSTRMARLCRPDAGAGDLTSSRNPSFLRLSATGSPSCSAMVGVRRCSSKMVERDCSESTAGLSLGPESARSFDRDSQRAPRTPPSTLWPRVLRSDQRFRRPCFLPALRSPLSRQPPPASRVPKTTRSWPRSAAAAWGSSTRPAAVITGEEVALERDRSATPASLYPVLADSAPLPMSSTRTW